MVIKTSALEPLRDGERLTADEFFARYEAMPDVKKCELIGGIVYMGSPVSYDNHGEPDHTLALALIVYTAKTPGVSSAGNTTCFLDDANQPQPDLFLRIGQGGSSHINERGYVVGPPELAAEIAFTSLDRDARPRRRMYLEASVQEYLIWRVEEQVLEWLILQNGAYEALSPRADGLLCSEVFPGLWIDPQAMIANDRSRILDVILQGTVSPEHAAFVQRLTQTIQE
jgi:Uma2 family endonuclease